MADQITYSLDSLPDGAWCRSVSAEPGVHDGRPGLRVALTEEIRTHGTPRVDYVDQPTFVVIPMELAAGRVEPILTAFPAPELGIYAILPSNRHVPHRVRVLMDFLAARVGAACSIDPR